MAELSAVSPGVSKVSNAVTAVGAFQPFLRPFIPITAATVGPLRKQGRYCAVQISVVKGCVNINRGHSTFIYVFLDGRVLRTLTRSLHVDVIETAAFCS